MSSSIAASMPGLSTLTATSRPSFSTAKCTWAIEALATGAASKLAKTLSIGRPNARSTVSRATSAGKGGTRSCSLASSLAMSAGIRSRRVEMTWPNLTKIGPSVSSPRRRRSPRGAGKVRPMLRTRARARTQRWRKLDSAISSRPKRKTVTQMVDQPGEVPHRGGGSEAGVAPGRVAAPGEAVERLRGLADRLGERVAEAGDLARRRVAHEPRQVVLHVPAQVLDQPVDVGREGGVALDPKLRPLADDELRERQRRIGGVDGHAQVGRHRRRTTRSTSTSPGGVMRKAIGEGAGSSDGQPSSSMRRVRAACARSLSIACGSAEITWFEEQHDPLHHRPFRERLHRLEHAWIVGGTP